MSEELQKTSIFISDDQGLDRVDNQVRDESWDEFDTSESLPEESGSSSPDSYSVVETSALTMVPANFVQSNSGIWNNLYASASHAWNGNYTEAGKSLQTAVVQTYDSAIDTVEEYTASPSKLVADAGKLALAVNPITAPIVAAHAVAVSPAMQKMADDVVQTVKAQAEQMVDDAVEYVAENHPEEVAAVQSLVASAKSYIEPLYQEFKEILPEPARAMVEAWEGKAVEVYAENRGALAPVLALLSGQPQIPATESVTEVAAVEETIEAAEVSRETATPVSAPIAGEEWIDPWGYGDNYGIANEEGEIVETDIVTVAEQDVAAPVATAPVEETVVAEPVQTAPAEAGKEETVAVTEASESEKGGESSKTVVAAQMVAEQTDVVSADENEGFTSNVEYTAELSTGAGVTVAAGQAASASLSVPATETTAKPRQKINLPAAMGETVAVADQDKSEQNGVAEKVSIDGVSVEEKPEVEVAVSDVTTGKSSSTEAPSSVVAPGGLTHAERIAEFDVRDGVADAGFVPVPTAAAATVSRKDSVATDGELGAVASNLDSPLNDVPGSGDKGFDSNDEGRDRSVENIHALASADEAGAEEEIIDADVIESSIFPSDVVV